MITVSNTSPVSNLAMIGRLDLMRAIYGKVLIPVAVRDELGALRHEAASSTIREAESNGWLETVSVPNAGLALALREELDAGEAEAIALAVERKARIVLDELDGRLVARRVGLSVRGVLWVLRQGKEMGVLSSLKDEIARLREEAHFWVSPKLEREFLRDSGE